MDNTTIDKIHLCLNEISICKQLFDSQKVDDVCGRLLSIYIMIRADDITKMWSHSLPKGEIERILSDEIKNKYNCKSGISETNWVLIIKQLQKIRLLTFLRTQEYLEALITALFQNLSMNYFLRKIS